MRFLVVAIFLLFATDVVAKEIAGVQIQEILQADDGTELKLNGAGVRSKFFFKIYIGSLYLQNPSTDSEQVIADDGRKVVAMHFLYDEVAREKLISAWNEGFEANNSKKELQALQDRIDQFNALFVTVKEGDVVELDYIPGKGTAVTIAGAEKGTIQGKDFNDALLKIWLGKEPVTSDLKEAMLGQQ